MKTTVSKSIILKTAVSFLFLIVCISKSTYAQVIQIKGKVSIIIDEEKEVLIGANIFLKGTSIGTSSDKKGLFTFPRKLNKGDILVISYLGFKKQETNIKLPHFAKARGARQANFKLQKTNFMFCHLDYSIEV